MQPKKIKELIEEPFDDPVLEARYQLVKEANIIQRRRREKLKSTVYKMDW